jgi:hypothetical protein
MRNQILIFFLMIAIEYRTIISCCANAELARGDLASQMSWVKGQVELFMKSLKIQYFSNLKMIIKLSLELIHDRFTWLLSVFSSLSLLLSIYWQFLPPNLLKEFLRCE